MRQTLFYIPTELFGLPLLGNGILFWAFVVFAICWLVWAYLKRGLRSDDMSFVVVLAIIAFLVRVFLPRIAEPGLGLPIRGYGMMLMLAITSASALLLYRSRKKWNIPTDTIFSLVLWCVVSGLIGARLFHIVEYWPTYINAKSPLLAMLMFSEGGLVVYGSIIGGMLGTAIFFVKHRLSILAMFDMLAPALMLGIAIGRLGCFLNGCCFGAVCEPAYGVVFPKGSPAHWAQLERNDVFLGGLKIVPESKLSAQLKQKDAQTANKSLSHDQQSLATQQLLTSQQSHTAAQPAANTLEETSETSKKKHVNQTLNFGGCACSGCLKLKSAKPDDGDDSPAAIAEVEPGSDAEKAGIKPGMIVRRVFVGEHDQRREMVNQIGTLNAFDVKKIMLDMTFDSSNGSLEFSVTEPGSNLEKPFRFQIMPPRVLPVYPTQLISFVGALCLCGLLLLLERLDYRDGFTTMLFLFMYPVARFCIELMRADETSFFGTGLSISQNVSIVIFIVAIMLAAFLYSRPPQHALADRFPKKEKSKK